MIVLIPNKIGIGPKIGAGATLDFPTKDTMSVSLPIGPESLFVFATEEEVTVTAGDSSSASRLDYLVAARRALPNTAADVETYFNTRTGKPKDPVPAVGLGISLDRQAASLCCSSHCSKNIPGERPLSDPWGRSRLYS